MKVQFGITRTIQTKPYESVKIAVSVEDERDSSKLPSENVERLRANMYKKLSKFVNEKIEEEEDKWL